MAMTKTTEQLVRDLLAQVTKMQDRTAREHVTGVETKGTKRGNTTWTDEWNHGYHDGLADVLDTVHNLGLAALLPENTPPELTEHETTLIASALCRKLNDSKRTFMDPHRLVYGHVVTDGASYTLNALRKINSVMADKWCKTNGRPGVEWDKERVRKLEATRMADLPATPEELRDSACSCCEPTPSIELVGHCTCGGAL